MCGIAGFFNLKLDDPTSKLKEMVTAIHHRGPDEAGIMHHNNIGLATARLAIIGIKDGQQPMSASNKRYWIAFNGEIFNYIEIRESLQKEGYSFSTSSDTEVLLKAYIAWGKDCLKKLNGQFALSIYDKIEESLFLARDPLGEKPLFYYHEINGAFVFASEIKSIFTVQSIKRELCPKSLSHAARLWATLPNRSCFKGIHQLSPGHFMLIHKGTIKTEPFYTLPFPKENNKATPQDVYSACHESVRLRLRSDVEVGTYLSGGLDSSITTTLAKKMTNKKLHTFSVNFDDPRYDETKEQKTMYQKLETEHHSLKISNNDIVDSFAKIIWHTETPQFRTAAIPLFHLSKLVREHNIKTVLTGEGSDEFFLGYNIYKETLLRASLDTMKEEDAIKCIMKLYPYLPHFNERFAALQLKFFKQFNKVNHKELLSHQPRFSLSKFSLTLLKHENEDDIDACLLENIYAEYPTFDKFTAIEKAQVIENKTLLSGYLLSSQGDRMSMANHVENRCPFLDTKLIELAQSIPVAKRLDSNYVEKLILKDAFATVIPKEITNRRKQPYLAGGAFELIKCDDSYIQSLLTPEFIEKSRLFKVKETADFLKRMKAKKADRLSPGEEQTIIFLISSLILYESFVLNFSIQQNKYKIISNYSF
jgi:asparagine synthase (glutamine-hydrolysing)